MTVLVAAAVALIAVCALTMLVAEPPSWLLACWEWAGPIEEEGDHR